MSSFNKTIIMGRLTRDPELKSTASGMSICKFGIASTRKFKGSDGNMKEDTLFIDVDAWGRQGEVIQKFFHKGSPIFVEGRLKLDQWESNTGEKRSKHSITLDSFEFVGSRDENAQAGNNFSAPQSAPAPAQQPAAPAGSPADFDDDIPF